MGKKLVAEFLGTFCLVFAGTGAIMIDSVTGGAVSHVGVALTFGLIVLAMIYTIGDISGAHINPAVTIGFFAARRFEAGSVMPGPICGASMNPARSLAPALVSGHLSGLWIYLVAPILGAALGVIGCRCVREHGCCSGAETADISSV